MASFLKSKGHAAAVAWLLLLAMLSPDEGNAMSWLRSDSAKTVAHLEPASFCLPAQDAALAEMMTGSIRPVLVLHAVNNVSTGSGKIEVRIDGTDISTVLGLFPGGGPQPGEESRFFLPRPDSLGSAPPCYIVTYRANDGASADISVELSDILSEGQD